MRPAHCRSRPRQQEKADESRSGIPTSPRTADGLRVGRDGGGREAELVAVRELLNGIDARFAELQDQLRDHDVTPLPLDQARPRIDSRTFTIEYNGSSCRLGNGLLWEFFRRLMRSPGIYVPQEALVAEVWQGRWVTDNAVRSVAARLRSRLRTAGMPDLAFAIDGAEPRHYQIQPIWQHRGKNKTQKRRRCSA